MSEVSYNSPLPKSTAAQTKGKCAELLTAAEFEVQGFPACDISRDFGLDLSLAVPANPLTCRQVDALRRSETTGGSFEVSAKFIHVQIKATNSFLIDSSHLAQWSAAIDAGSTIIIAFLRGGRLRIYEPEDIQYAFRYCCAEGKKHVAMKKAAGEGHLFELNSSSNRLGLFLYGLSECPSININFDSIDRVCDWSSFIDFFEEYRSILEQLIFIKYPVGRALDTAFLFSTEIGSIRGSVESFLLKLLEVFESYVQIDFDDEDLDDYVNSFLIDFEWRYRVGEKYTYNQMTDDEFQDPPPPRLNLQLENFYSIIRAALDR